jgi:hypothetical protein
MTGPRDYPRHELPAHDRLADDADELGWDTAKHGRMADYAVDPEDEIQTEAYDPDADPFIEEG